MISGISAALEAAVRAPSAFNTQPWLFDVDGGRIDLILDRSRVLQVSDPDAREARLSCGAALANLRLALRAQGRAGLVDLAPEPALPDLLARVTVRSDSDEAATANERKLAEAIPKRHTNRHPFLDRPVPIWARSKLASAAGVEGAKLVFIDASPRYDLLVDLIGTAERVQENHGEYQHEMKQWLGGSVDRRDGVPVDAVGPPPTSGRLLAMRSFYRPSPIPPRRFEEQPLLVAVVASAVNRVRCDLIAGAGMQRALLTACTLGLNASFISQPFEVPATRAELNAAFRRDGDVHALLRIGYGYPAGVTPRRAVEDVTVH